MPAWAFDAELKIFLYKQTEITSTALKNRKLGVFASSSVKQMWAN